ncbi:MAG TPA: FAD-binding protein, partial [Acidimicrobiales bacterium]|nr:FAD-binding protein [Acidimicrobiales bacterium]
ALAYIRRLAMGHEHDPSLIEVFVDTVHEMVAYLEAKTPVRFAVVPNFPDYYFPYDVPGKKPGARSIEPVPFAVGTELPEWRDRLVTRGTLMSLGANTTLGEDLSGVQDERLAAELARREAEDVRSKGAALIGMLFKGLLERGVDVLLSTPGRELVVAGGAVVGVRCEQDGADLWVGARKGVVLACGGFEWNREMVRAFIGYDLYPVSPPNNVGDGLVMAAEAGGALANMNSYWGTPAMLDPAIVRDGDLVPQFDAGRGLPGTVIVNQHGVRFVNEAVPYNDWPKVFGDFDPSAMEYPNQAPAWMIFDHQVKESVKILSIIPGEPVPDWVPQAPTVRGLAERLGLDPTTVETTIARFNENAARGEDPDFERHRVGLMGVAPLRPVDQPPFYAVAMYPGTLGTNGGPRLNANGQVRSVRGGVVPGLYAAGNTAANAYGSAYPSGGGTIANGMTFGYLAGRHAAAQTPRPIGPRP